MSKFVSRRHIRLLSQATVLSVVAALGAGCSSDFSRLSDSIMTSSNQTVNQRAIIARTSAPVQPYPGDVDPIRTASTRAAPTARATRVASRAVSQPYPGDVVTRKPIGRIKSSVRTSSRPVSLLPNAPEGANETVIPARRAKLTDRLPRSTPTTPRVVETPSRPVSVADTSTISRRGGWTAAGGTRVTLRQGESLYNMSRRYGVPVKEIMRVNNIEDANSVRAGQNVLIPTYTYSRKAAVSAPDSNPTTLASRSSRGFEGEVRTQRLTVPTPKPYRTAAVRAVKSDRVAKPSRSPRPEKVQTASAGKYLVVSGDTLGGIARRYGISRDAIRQANGLNGDVIRLGQKLIIPTSDKLVRIASRRKTSRKTATDPIVTGGPASSARNTRRFVSKGKKPASYTPPERSAEIARRATEKGPTPSQTGVSKFRWPANGRVVAGFGAKVNGSANDGIDISVPVGTPVKAAENGTVIYAGSELEDFGKLILVRHSGGWVSAYAYSSRNLVKRGDKVRRGQMIARSGRSGTARVPKIHFELRKNSNPVNPIKHLKRV